MSKLLLFDIDGTLLLSHGAGIRAMLTAGRSVFGDHFTLEGIVTAGGIDPLIYQEATAINKLDNPEKHHDAFRDAYIAELRKEFNPDANEIETMPGVIDLLATLRTDKRISLGLVTGNYANAVPIKLRAANIDPDWFAFNGFGDEGENRAALVTLAIKRHADSNGNSLISGADIVVIGDTPRDVQCAKDNGCLSLAVATGPYTVEQLRDAGADVAVEDLSDKRPLLQLINN